MILVVDSGATNSTWKFMTPNTAKIFTRPGLNLSTSNILNFDFTFPEFRKEVSKILFFGAGSGYNEKDELLRKQILTAFPDCTSIIIKTDLESAAIALSQGQKSIVAILGSGSNSCLYDGKEIIDKAHNLGYILGDEGSGFAMGRSVLQAYFYGKMEITDRRLFEDLYGLSRPALIKKVYHSNQKSSAYIASFCQFLSSSSEGLRRQIAHENLAQFFDHQLAYYGERASLPINFSGSISWHFWDSIEEICRKYAYKLGNIIQNPIDSLSYSQIIEL